MYNNKNKGKFGGINMKRLMHFLTRRPPAGTIKSVHELTHEMTQAFYRREHDTIERLAADGALFTQEMLHIASAYKDPQLVLKCLHGGIVPAETESAVLRHHA